MDWTSSAWLAELGITVDGTLAVPERQDRQDETVPSTQSSCGVGPSLMPGACHLPSVRGLVSENATAFHAAAVILPIGLSAQVPAAGAFGDQV